MLIIGKMPMRWQAATTVTCGAIGNENVADNLIVGNMRSRKFGHPCTMSRVVKAAARLEQRTRQ